MTYDDDDLGRQLEQVLRGEADTVQPIGDGLQLIRRKIERRRSRRRLIVPLTGIAGIAAVGTIAYAVFGGTDPDRLNQATPAVTNTATGSPTATPSPSPTSTDGLAIADDPSLAIWPFAHASDAGSWTKNDTNGWMASQKLVAQKFVETFGGALGSSVNAEQPILEGGDIVVPVSRKVDNGPTVEVALVHLHQWASGPLSVVAVTEPDRGFTNLNPGDTLTPGQAIRGIHHTEDLYTLNVYEAAGTKSIGSARSAAISGTEWSAKVDFSTQAPLGSVVATDASLADGGLGAMIAVPVQFGTGGTGAPSATPTPTGTAGGLPGYMTTIVGTKDGRVAYFGTASGAFKGYLTGQTAGGGDSAPSMSPDRQWVYFLRGTGTCANEIARVPFPGGGEANV
ncbi:MAG: hypothetical protein QOK14_1244, partial [Frankiaceae bacterium]|nr:hypothetical protein [Frankiaceae bacterium]